MPTAYQSPLSNKTALTLIATLAAFSTYSCMYAFRKPFTAATYQGLVFASLDLKIWLVIAQLIGYTLSKFIGIRFVSELGRNKRAIAILALIALSEIALLLFAILPVPLKIFALFLNGLPLGMVWGLVFSFLEGRKQTEFMGAGLSVSFIFSSGMVKSAGKWLMSSQGVSEWWMPFLTGLLFLAPLLLSTWLLSRIPPPDTEDELSRTPRKPMNAEERSAFFRKFSFGLTALIAVYILLTAFRDFRDNFAAEIWTALGFGNTPSVFTTSETIISFAVLLIMSALMLVKNNARAFLLNHALILIGLLLSGISALLYHFQLISPLQLMIGTGLGVYMGYVPFNCILFDRLIAAFRTPGNAGFLMYLSDSFGYLGSVAVLFYKNFGGNNLPWLPFFLNSALYMMIFGGIGISAAFFYFAKKLRTAGN
jgi:MFS family permease